jgi:hypothetical protein
VPFLSGNENPWGTRSARLTDAKLRGLHGENRRHGVQRSDYDSSGRVGGFRPGSLHAGVRVFDRRLLRSR